MKRWAWERESRAQTREERNAAERTRYAINKEKRKATRRAHREANGDALREKARTVYDAKPKRKARKAELERTDKMKAMRLAYRIANPRIEYFKEYESEYRARRKELHDIKQAADPQYRLRRTLRARLKQAIRKHQKCGSAISDLGCSIAHLRVHLEQQFVVGMSWENFGRLDADGLTWQIDHINPLSHFDLTDPSQLSTACHFSNLRPLWARDNRKKGNKLILGSMLNV